MGKQKLVLLTNIDKFFEKAKIFSRLGKNFSKEDIPENEDELTIIFSEKKFILSVINGDREFSKSYIKTLAALLTKSNFPALVLATRANIKKYVELFPITVNYLVKPVTHFDFYLRVSRIMEIYKMSKKLDMLNYLENEIEAREKVLELSRQELITGMDTIKALDIAMDMSRDELLKQKEEISAREQVLETSRMDKIDLMSSIKALEEIVHHADRERMDSEREIKALENLLNYMINKRKK